MDPRRILVIQLRRIGDVILTTPALRALRAKFPQARLDVLVEPPGAQALEGNPDVTELVVYEAKGLGGALGWLSRVRARRYELVVDLMGNPRTALLTAFSGAAVKAGPGHVAHRWAYGVRLPQSAQTRYAGLEKLLMLAPLGVRAEGADFMPRLYLASRPEKLRHVVCLAPASRKETRRWPAAKYAALGRLLRDKLKCGVVVLWGPGERALAEEVARGVGEGAVVAEETKTLRDAARVLASCRLLVTNCSGTKHLAVGLGVPTVTVHFSSDPAAWNPPSPRHLVARREDLPCIGCRSSSCRYNLECMELPVEDVLAKCERLLAAEAEEARPA